MILDFLTRIDGTKLYPYLLGCWGILALGAGIGLLMIRKDEPAKFGRISRARVPGTILGTIVLLWCVPHAAVILPDSLKGYLVPAAIVIAVLSCWTLDHLFSRAIGAFMILSAHFFLRESFASPTAGSCVFAFLCMLFGILGIFLSGQPYKFRNALALGAGKYRLFLPVFLMIFASGCIITLVLNLLRGGNSL